MCTGKYSKLFLLHLNIHLHIYKKYADVIFKKYAKIFVGAAESEIAPTNHNTGGGW